MSDHNNDAMIEATRLTREGRLAEAIALIQRHLGRAPGTPRPPTTAAASPRVIEATYRISDGPAPETPPVSPLGPEPPVQAGRIRAGGVLPAGRAVGKRARRAIPREAIAPAAGRWIKGTHTDPAGSRGYKLYVPGGHRGESLPLVVMLHGCTQDPDDFAAGTAMNFLAEADRFLVVYPAQGSTANPSKCWNWFQPGHQQHGQGEPAVIAGLTRRVMTEFQIDPGRVYVAGLSAGGAMAAILATAYPDLFAAVGVHSGLAPGSAHDLPSALQAMQGGGEPGHVKASVGRAIPLILFQGDADSTVHPSNADRLLGQWIGDEAPGRAGTTVPAPAILQGKSAGGRAYTRARYRDPQGQTLADHWTIHGAGHAWSGGSAHGSYTDPAGPDASRELVRFFREHPRTAVGRPPRG